MACSLEIPCVLMLGNIREVTIPLVELYFPTCEVKRTASPSEQRALFFLTRTCARAHVNCGGIVAAPKIRKYQIYPWLYRYFVLGKLCYAFEHLSLQFKGKYMKIKCKTGQ